MKISELIKKLEALQKAKGDKELRFNVYDHYSIYPKGMTTELSTGQLSPDDWRDVWTHNDTCTISFHLKESHEGEYPKITFRK